MLKKFRESFLLELIVFTSGALVMIYEIVGSRLLAPYIGTSTYIWTSLIGVILGSLSLGYWLGGKLADKKPSLQFLAGIIFLNGGILSLTILFQNIILAIISSFSLRLECKSIIAALILFAPASVLFGFVTPYAVKLKMDNVENAGKTVGRLYAFSTIGSILGTFLAGFVLLPFIGTIRSLYIITGIIFVLSVLLAPFKTSITNIFAIILFPSAILFSEIYAYSMFKSYGMIDFDTQYNRLQIYRAEDNTTKKPMWVLSTDPLSAQSAMFTDNNDLALPYTKYYHLLSHFKPDFQQTLIIGGAAYSFPKNYLEKYPNKQIDVVEIDPQMTKIARQYFRLEDNPNLQIFHQDGRIFLNQNQKKYDVILIDAFTSLYSVPFQLTTIEAVKEIKRSLTDDGIVIVNMISAFEGEGAKFLQAEYKTYQEVFSNIYLFKPNNKAENLAQNVILIASKKTGKVKINSSNETISNLLKNYYEKTLELTVPILTDDLAPIEYYNSLAQKYSDN